MKIKKQNDIQECGLNVIQALHYFFFHKWIDINHIRSEANITSLGMNLQSMINLGDKFGIEMEAFKVSFKTLLDNKNENMIALIQNQGQSHYVIFKFNGSKFFISDPAKGNYYLTIEEFEKIFCQIVLTIKEKIHSKIKDNSKSLLPIIFKNPILVLWIVISSLFGIIFSFISTLFSKEIFDYVLPGMLSKTLILISIAFSFLAFIRVINMYVKKYLIKKLEYQVQVSIFASFSSKYGDSSIIDINKISRSDQLRRMALIAEVSTYLANGIFLIFNESIVFIIATSMMIWISSSLFAISLGFMMIMIIISVLFQYILKEKYDELLHLSISNFQSQIDLIFSLKENKEHRVFNNNMKKMNFNLSNYFKTEYKVWKITNFQMVIDEFISLLTPIILTYFSVKLIFANQLSSGSMLMFLGVFNSFINPSLQICNFLIKIPQNSKNISLLKYILFLKNEELNLKGFVLPSPIKKIKIDELTFGYDKKLINIRDFEINSHLNIEGKNGTGKSTFLNNLCLRLMPKGKIFFNDIEKDFLNLQDVRNRIFYASPQTYFQNGTIMEYITLNSQQAIEKFNSNCYKYNLLEFLDSFGLKMNFIINNNGENLSSGQRQIVSLMRLFAFEYDFVMLDEAMENIDLEKVKLLRQYLKDYSSAIFVEISHSKKYIFEEKVVDFEEINNNTL